MEESKIQFDFTNDPLRSLKKIGGLDSKSIINPKLVDDVDIDSRREKLAVLRINNEKKLINIAFDVGTLDKDQVEIKFIDQFEWRLAIRGEKDTIWEGGLYCATIKFPKDYPDSPPIIVFDSDFQHIHVYPNGSICLYFLEKELAYKATVTTPTLINTIIRLIHEEPNIESPANVELNQIYTNNREEMNNSEFFKFSDFLVPIPDLCGKIVKLEYGASSQIISLSVEIKNDRYRRKKHEFSISFIVSQSIYEQYSLVIPELVRKIVYFFVELEMDYQTVYKGNNTASTIRSILDQIYKDLNTHRECFIKVATNNFLFLVVLEKDRYLPLPEEIKDYEVPLPLADLREMEVVLKESDLSWSKLISLINGVNPVKKIELESKIERKKLVVFLQSLLYHNLIKMVDIFQFSNIYTTTHTIKEFIGDIVQQNKGVEYCVKPDQVEKFDRIELLTLYLGFSKKVCLKDFIAENYNKVSKLNFAKFIQFGLIHKFLRRVHEYPIKSSYVEYFNKENVKKYLAVGDGTDIEREIANLNKLINEKLHGTCCLDELTVFFDKSRFELESEFKKHRIFILEK